ncbi:response regulator [Poseidonibacter lekithochrous]|uniref:response regulator n=1 Tax=Poseidonibacter lekithochrous TaxID=1904463 RepID=UPI0008FC584F|nr:response regulator [Poseidonibacter lekithochrous]QKJ22669.1 signal transduction response regulator [Poseidonibacter lekithochrous]
MKTDVNLLIKLAKGKKVLLIEDDEQILEIFKVALETYFSLVKTAADGKEAWDLFRKEHFDLIVSDIQMPNTNGIMLSKGIKAHTPEQNILITSAYTDEKYLLELIDIGVDGFLKKPISTSNLKNTITKILKKIQSKKELERVKFNTYVKQISKRTIDETRKSPTQVKIEQDIEQNAKVSVKEFLEKIKIEDPESYYFFENQKEILMDTLYDMSDNFDSFVYKEYKEEEHLEELINDIHKLHSTLSYFDRVEKVTSEVLRLAEVLDDIKLDDINYGTKEEAFSILEFLINDIKQYILDMFMEENVQDVNYFHDSYRENITFFENTINQKEKEDDNDLEFF